MGIGCLHGLRVRVDPFDAGTCFHHFPQENRLLAWSGLSRAMMTHRSACEPEDGAAGSPGAAPSGRIGRLATTRGAGARRRKPATERVAGHVPAAAERCRPEAVGALGALRQRPPTDPPSRRLHRAPPGTAAPQMIRFGCSAMPAGPPRDWQTAAVECGPAAQSTGLLDGTASQWIAGPPGAVRLRGSPLPRPGEPGPARTALGSSRHDAHRQPPSEA